MEKRKIRRYRQSTGERLRSRAAALIDFLFPGYCTVCGRPLLEGERHFCLGCFSQLPLTYFWTFRDNPAEMLFRGRLPVERAYALIFYTGRYRKPVHLFKYGSRLSIGRYLGKMLGEKIKSDPYYDPPELIVPVPLHPRKRRKRGFNQSEVIARSIGRVLQVPVSTRLLRRKRFTRTQTRKERIGRWLNVRDAFRTGKPPSALGREFGEKRVHVLLIDDVLTTGATLDACGNLLVKEFGCRISTATLACVE